MINKLLLAVILTLPFCVVRAESPQSAKADGITITPKSWDNVLIADGDGNALMTITGFQPSWDKKAKVVSGTLRPFTLPSGAQGAEVTYALASPMNKVDLKSRFTQLADRIDVQLEVSGLTGDDKALSGKLGRRMGPGAAFVGVNKLGQWRRQANGGVPYEQAAGYLLSWLVKDKLAVLAFNGGKGASDKQAELDQPITLAKVRPGHFASSFAIFSAPRDTSPEVTAARWRRDPLGLHLGTERVYNWWTDNKAPLEVKPILANTSDKALQVDYSYWVRNFAGDVVAESRRKIDLPAGESIQAPIQVKAAARDLLFVEVSAKDTKTGWEVFARTNLAVLPPHEFKSTAENSIFGLAAFWPLPTQADVKRLMQRMGVRWLRNADTREYADIGIVANCHRATPGLELKQPQRDEFIRKQLALCIERKNPYWEVLNEVNFAGGGIGMGDEGIGKANAVEKYVEYLRDIRRVQQESGMTQVKLMNAGLAGMDKVFVKKFFDAGGWGLIDALAIHPGRGNFAADYGLEKPQPGWAKGAAGNYWNFYGSIRTASGLAKQLGGGKPVWITEMHAPTYPFSAWNDTLRGSAENIVLQYALAAAEGVRVAMQYQLFDSTWHDQLGVAPKNREYFFGLANRDLSFKPSLMAYCAAAEALDQSKFIRPLSFGNPHVRGLLFKTPRGAVAVLWSRADGYVLTQKSESYAAPEPWISSWKTRTPLVVPAMDNTVSAVNAIGQRVEIPVNGQVARLELTGAPTIVLGLDVRRLK